MQQLRMILYMELARMLLVGVRDVMVDPMEGVGWVIWGWSIVQVDIIFWKDVLPFVGFDGLCGFEGGRGKGEWIHVEQLVLGWNIFYSVWSVGGGVEMKWVWDW